VALLEAVDRGSKPQPLPESPRTDPREPLRYLAMLRSCVYLYLAETPPMGLGVLTARPIAAGTVIVADEDGSLWGRAVSLAEALAQGWDRDHDLFQIGPDLFLPPRGCLDDLFNHSCDPSGGWQLTPRGARFLAIRDLAAGEQLTYDYSCHLLSSDERMACSCGSLACRGLIGPFWTLPPPAQRRYRELGVVSPTLLATG
jgi:hypothetical protein